MPLTSEMNFNFLKKLLRWYLIYHLSIDFIVVLGFTYDYCFSENPSTWCYRIIDNPLLFVKLLWLTPLYFIISIGELIMDIVKLGI